MESRIYAACLAAYNNGHLHGAWIDANQSASDLMAAIQEMLADSPIPNAGEWAIHDHEGLGNIAEYESLENVAAIAELVQEHGPLAVECLNESDDVDSAREMLTDRYFGEYDSVIDFAESYLEDCGDLEQIPEHLRGYFDFQAYARDLEHDLTVIRIDHKCHIFHA